ncbi:DUF2971 domain-containing protein [Corallococcus exiguus]|uniref:DUF2971 domain-containing protein n=1 Tax=Corallococcus exiguus TaxID=83462 RepID=UPI001471AAF1|nr:DUF2971 domain-containing protein [Corallococcus exiguus]NNC17377.1 DUF2971 domain-containing protein [Corallococcus exiguus]
MDPHQNAAAAVEKLRKDCLADFVRMDNNPPITLYHYTDARGLLGILDTKHFWFSQAGFLNDSTELTHADSIIRSALNRRLEFTKSLAAREMLTAALNSVDPFSTYSAGSFIACFCENGDLLSQWRGYGSSGGGFALGFESKQLERNLEASVGSTAGTGIFKVVYDPAKQDSYVKDTIEAFCQLVEHWEQTGGAPPQNKLLDVARFGLETALADPYFRFKHPGFEEEQEWRLIVFRELTHPDLKFRPSGTRIVPFFDVDMRRPPGDGPPLLPLTHVVCGPTQTQAVAAQAIQSRIEREYPKGSIKISSSSVPFRV